MPITKTRIAFAVFGVVLVLLVLRLPVRLSTDFNLSQAVDAPILVSLAGAPSGNFQPGGSFSIAFQATGAPSGRYEWGMNGPNWLSINQNGRVRGTIPQNQPAGSVPFAIWAVDATDSTIGSGAVQSSIVVQAAPATIQITGNLPPAIAGTPYSGGLTATGGSGSYTFSSLDIDSGLSLNANGSITGTPTLPPTFLTGGIERFTATVIDSAGNTKSARFEIRINPTTGNLTIIGNLPAATIGQVYSGQLTATGGSGGYTWTSNLVPGLSEFQLSGDGKITGKPTSGQSVTFSVTVTDSADVSVTASFTIIINPAPASSQPPDVCVSVRENTPPGWVPGGSNAPKPGDPAYPIYSLRLKCWAYGIANNPGYTTTKRGTYCIPPYPTDWEFYDGPNFNQARYNSALSSYYSCVSAGGGVSTASLVPTTEPPTTTTLLPPTTTTTSAPNPAIAPRVVSFSPLTGQTGAKITIRGRNFNSGDKVVMADSAKINATRVNSRILEFNLPTSLLPGVYRLQVESAAGQLSAFSSRLLTVTQTSSDPTMYYLVPLAMRAGRTYSITAYGYNFDDVLFIDTEEEDSPIDIDLDSLDVKLLSGGRVKLKFTVTIPAGTPLGLRYLILETGAGKSLRFPLVVRN